MERTVSFHNGCVKELISSDQVIGDSIVTVDATVISDHASPVWRRITFSRTLSANYAVTRCPSSTVIKSSKSIPSLTSCASAHSPPM